MPKTRTRVKVILILSILLALLFLKLITPETYTGYDGSFYAAMTRELISDNPKTTTASYNYRLLPAWLLHFVPLETKTTFTLYNTIIGLLSAYLLFFLFLDSGFSFLESGLGIFFFLFSWVNVRFHFYYPILLGPTYYLIIILAFQALLRKNDLLFLISLVLGSLTRENFFTLILVYYFHQVGKGRFWDGKACRKTLVLAAGPALIFCLLRLLIPNTNPDFSYLKNLEYFVRLASIYWARIIHSYFNVYGVVLFIFLLHLPTCLRYLSRNLYLAVYLVLVIVISIISGSDTCRYNFYGFPAIFIPALHAMSKRRIIYRNKLMLGYLVLSHLVLMRVFRPMIPANYRQIWWSQISFRPEAIFRQSSLQFALFAAGFVLLYLGLYLRSRRLVKSKN